MPINNSYNEEAIVKAIATALDSFYTNLIGNIDKLNIKKVMNALPVWILVGEIPKFNETPHLGFLRCACRDFHCIPQ